LFLVYERAAKGRRQPAISLISLQPLIGLLTEVISSACLLASVSRKVSTGYQGRYKFELEIKVSEEQGDQIVQVLEYRIPCSLWRRLWDPTRKQEKLIMEEQHKQSITD